MIVACTLTPLAIRSPPMPRGPKPRLVLLSRARFTPPRYIPPRSGTETVVLTEKIENDGNCTVVAGNCCWAISPSQHTAKPTAVRLRIWTFCMTASLFAHPNCSGMSRGRSMCLFVVP
jgi:hypothetical protein